MFLYYMRLTKYWLKTGILCVYRNPALQDEYEEYLPSLFRFICEQASETEIFEYLWWVENKVMEVKGNKTHTLKIAHLLKDLQED